MPQARDTGHTHAILNPSRRAMLAGATAALAAGFAKPPPLPWRGGPRPAPVPGDDAELLRLLDQSRREGALIDAIEEEGHHLPDGITPESKSQERRLDEAMDAREVTWARIASMPAATPAGMRVKAEALGAALLLYTYTLDAETLEDIAENGSSPERLALSLARDVLAWRTVA